jgi:hypothetical protein
MAEVFVFPVTRNRSKVRRTAAFMASVPERHGEGHLREQIRRLREGLTRRGVPAPLVEQECRSYEVALRAELWRIVLLEGGGAA